MTLLSWSPKATDAGPGDLVEAASPFCHVYATCSDDWDPVARFRGPAIVLRRSSYTSRFMERNTQMLQVLDRDRVGWVSVEDVRRSVVCGT